MQDAGNIWSFGSILEARGPVVQGVGCKGRIRIEIFTERARGLSGPGVHGARGVCIGCDWQPLG
jgi:hypothetical protein